MKKTAAVLLLASTILFQATADDVEELLEFISDKDLSVHIELSLLDKDNEISWDAESTHITDVDRSVNLRLAQGILHRGCPLIVI